MQKINNLGYVYTHRNYDKFQLKLVIITLTFINIYEIL